MAAPIAVLGQAVRKHGTAPSTEWIAGFDAGYDATVASIGSLVKLCDTTQRQSKEARSHLAKAQQVLAYLEKSIGEFSHPIVYESIIHDDLKKRD